MQRLRHLPRLPAVIRPHVGLLQTGFVRHNSLLLDITCPSWLNEGFAGRLREQNTSGAEVTTKTPVVKPIEQPTSLTPLDIEAAQLFQTGNLDLLHEKLEAYKDSGMFVSTETIVEMTSLYYNNPPVRAGQGYLLESITEDPLFYAKRDLWQHVLYLERSAWMQGLHKVYALYESNCIEDEAFLSRYIWLCYHTEDLQSLQRLLHHYLKLPLYDSRTLGYIVNAYSYCHDVQFAKTLLSSFIGMNKPLTEALLSSVLVSFVKVGALYDVIYDAFMEWNASSTCESPFPLSMALVLEQTYKYGTPEQVEQMTNICEQLGYDRNILVQMIRQQAKIYLRDHEGKKALTDDDIKEILETKKSLGMSRLALSVYYESYVQFLSKYSTIRVIQILLKEMRKDKVPISKLSCDAMVNHFANNHKFVQLLEFMEKFVSKSNACEPAYIKALFTGFVKAYPHNGEEFTQQMALWIQSNDALSNEEREILSAECQISVLRSNLKPCDTVHSMLRIYDKQNRKLWLQVKSGSDGDANGKSQVRVRLEQELRDLARKGIRPEYGLVESTFKHLGYQKRIDLLQRLQSLGYARRPARLEIHHFFLTKPTRDQIHQFARDILDKLNTSDKLFLARKVSATHDHDLTTALLMSVDQTNMTDTREMFRFNLLMRIFIESGNYDGLTEAVEKFPLDRITLSEYLVKQCMFVEKALKRKIAAAEISSPEKSTVDMTNALSQVQAFIGNVQARLHNDKAHIQALSDRMFRLLDSWVPGKTE